MYNPSYLIKSRHSIYYFRYPVKVCGGVSHRMSISLRTRCPKEALQLARALEYNAFIMMNDTNLKNLDYIDIKEILREHFAARLERMKGIIDRDGALPERRVAYFKDEKLLAEDAIARGHNELYGFILGDNNTPDDLSIDNDLEPIIQRYNLPTDKNSKENLVLKKEYKYALDGYITALLSYNDSDGFYDLDKKPISAVSNISRSELELKNIVAVYAKEIKPHKGAKGFEDHMGCLRYLVEVLGNDCLITQVDFAKARKVKAMLQRTPSNRNKLPLTRGLPLAEQVEVGQGHGLELLSISSVNKNLGYMSSLFAWAKRHNYLTENPFEGLKIKAKKKSSRRDNFKRSEVSTILEALANMDKTTAKNKTRYWGAMIAIYTGARLNEIAALTPDDVKQDSSAGIWYFDITDNDDSKSVKTEAAKRLVPVHSKLLELGLLEYVESARKVVGRMPEQSGHKPRLLYDLTYTKGGKWGRKLGRWFNDVFLGGIGLKTSKKTLHSLRHSFITYLSAASVDDAIVKSIVGHESDKVTIQTYTHYGVEHLSAFQDAVERLGY